MKEEEITHYLDGYAPPVYRLLFIEYLLRYEWVYFQELVKAKEEKERVEEEQRLRVLEMQRREEEKDKLLKVGDHNLLFNFINVDIADLTQLQS